jgi:hypothetical protein
MEMGLGPLGLGPSSLLGRRQIDLMDYSTSLAPLAPPSLLNLPFHLIIPRRFRNLPRLM